MRLFRPLFGSFDHSFSCVLPTTLTIGGPIIELPADATQFFLGLKTLKTISWRESKDLDSEVVLHNFQVLFKFFWKLFNKKSDGSSKVKFINFGTNSFELFGLVLKFIESELQTLKFWIRTARLFGGSCFDLESIRECLLEKPRQQKRGCSVRHSVRQFSNRENCPVKVYSCEDLWNRFWIMIYNINFISDCLAGVLEFVNFPVASGEREEEEDKSLANVYKP